MATTLLEIVSITKCVSAVLNIGNSNTVKGLTLTSFLSSELTIYSYITGRWATQGSDFGVLAVAVKSLVWVFGTRVSKISDRTAAAIIVLLTQMIRRWNDVAAMCIF